jgi:putative spermidine/putrescine transport system substrate-binding protein
VEVQFIPEAGADALVKARAHVVDVVFGDPIFSFTGEVQDLWEELDEKSIPNLKHLYDFGRLSEYTIITDFGVYGIAYNPKFIKKPPTSWLDLWNPEYKGKVTMRSFRPDTIELMILMAKMNGGDERHIDPGFKKMSELGDNVRVWWHGHSECLLLFKNEDVWLSVWTNGRTAWAKREGANVEFVIPKEGGSAMISTVNVVKGGKNVELAKKFVNWRLSDQPQRRLAEVAGYTPIRKGVILEPEAAKIMPAIEEIESLQVSDWRYILTVWDEWSERWNMEIVH